LGTEDLGPSPGELELFRFADDPETALQLLKEGIALDREEGTPAFAKSMTSCCRVPVAMPEEEE